MSAAAVRPEEQEQILQLVRDFAAEHIAPHAARWDAEKHFDRGVIDRLGTLGFLGMLVPSSDLQHATGWLKLQRTNTSPYLCP